MYGETPPQNNQDDESGRPTPEEGIGVEAHYIIKHATERPPESDETPEQIAQQQSDEYQDEVEEELRRLREEQDASEN